MKPENRHNWGALLLCLLVCALLVFAGLLIPKGYACEEQATGYETYTDTTWWAVESETRELCGMLRPCEQVATLPAQSTGVRVRGFLEDGGCIRVAARLRVISAGGQLLGLTALNNTAVRIRQDMLSAVQEIVWREIGEGTEVCGGSVSTCILHLMEDSAVSERLATTYSGFVSVGYVLFNVDISRTDLVEIVICDWDGDGLPDLCLRTGSAPEPVKEPEPDIPESKADTGESERKETKANESAAKPASQECWKLELHWSFDLLLQRCKKVFGL